MLGPFERLFNTPTLMLERAKNGCRELADWQIGRNHPNEPIWCHTLDRPDLRRSTRAALVSTVPLVRLIERDHGIHLIAVCKGAHRCPATTGLFAAHTELDLALIEVRHQPCRRIAPIKD